MNTIYNIYKNQYNSILSKTASKTSNAKTVVNRVMESFKERFIKIISLSAKLDERQEDIFRDMVDDAIRANNAKYITCQFPRALTGYLIASSNGALTKNDFRGFPSNQKDWEFSTDLWRQHFVTVEPRLNLKDLSKIPENEVVTYKYDVVRFGKTVIVRANTMVYMWIDGLHKVVAMMGDTPTIRNRKLDYVME